MIGIKHIILILCFFVLLILSGKNGFSVNNLVYSTPGRVVLLYLMETNLCADNLDCAHGIMRMGLCARGCAQVLCAGVARGLALGVVSRRLCGGTVLMVCLRSLHAAPQG